MSSATIPTTIKLPDWIPNLYLIYCNAADVFKHPALRASSSWTYHPTIPGVMVFCTINQEDWAVVKSMCNISNVRYTDTIRSDFNPSV